MCTYIYIYILTGASAPAGGGWWNPHIQVYIYSKQKTLICFWRAPRGGGGERILEPALRAKPFQGRGSGVAGAGGWGKR